ncbi:MAG: hypothetical protein Kow0059_08160 [Candidatus Sumerlaeia bacterium]
MRDMEYIIPGSLEEALSAYADHAPRHRTRLLAGGTDFVCEIKDGVDCPTAVIQINHLRELRGIELRDGRVHIGAATTWRDVELSPLVRERVPLLHLVTGQFASVQIRVMATVGGNLATASPAGDGIPPLFALDAELTLRSARGVRRVPIGQFYLDRRRTVLAPDEMITAVDLPLPDPDEIPFFIKLGQRASLNIAKVSVCGLTAFNGAGAVRKVRVAYGAVTPVIRRGRRVEEFIRGKRLTPEVLEAAADLAMSEVTPISDLRSTDSYRRRMTGVLLKRGLLQCAAQAGCGG